MKKLTASMFVSKSSYDICSPKTILLSEVRQLIDTNKYDRKEKYSNLRIFLSAYDEYIGGVVFALRSRKRTEIKGLAEYVCNDVNEKNSIPKGGG